MVELQRGMVGEHGYVFLLEPRPFASGSKTPDFANTIPAFLAFMAVAFTFFDFPFCFHGSGRGNEREAGWRRKGESKQCLHTERQAFPPSKAQAKLGPK